MTTLKHCPFCGSEAIVFDGFPFNYYIKCKTCGVQSDDRANRDSAVKAWNKRQPAPDLVEALGELLEFVESKMWFTASPPESGEEPGDQFTYDAIGPAQSARQALADIKPDMKEVE